MKISKETVDRLRERATLKLAEYGYTLEDVRTKVVAWDVAHRIDIIDLYRNDRTIHDSHVETALRSIFPNMPR